MTVLFAVCKRFVDPDEADLHGTEIRYFVDYSAAMDSINPPCGSTLEFVYDIIGLDGITERNGFSVEATNEFAQDVSYYVWVEDCIAEDD